MWSGVEQGHQLPLVRLNVDQWVGMGLQGQLLVPGAEVLPHEGAEFEVWGLELGELWGHHLEHLHLVLDVPGLGHLGPDGRHPAVGLD